MPVLTRLAGFVLLFALAAVPAAAQKPSPKQIDTAVQNGAKFLKERYGKGGIGGGGGNAIVSDAEAAAALAGLALLETGTLPNDPAVQAITAAVREAAYKTGKTYSISLYVLFLDRLGDPADVPLLQTLGVRLLVGQGPSHGGWTYDCCPDAPDQDVRTLKAAFAQRVDLKDPATGKTRLHPTVVAYGNALRATANPGGEDNSNSQFAIIALWIARRHGVNADAAFALVEARYLTTQLPTGGWSYNGGAAGGSGTPSMTCAGLIGLAIGYGRREERKLSAEKADGGGPKAGGGADVRGDDPFLNPPRRAVEKKEEKRPGNSREAAVQRAQAALGQVIAAHRRGQPPLLKHGKGASGAHGVGDTYFLWSLERVGVIYGQEKFGGVDWYDLGSEALVHTQGANGTWSDNYSAEVDTAFALLFLTKSNVVRDLTSRVSGDAEPKGKEPKEDGPKGPAVVGSPELPPAPKPDALTEQAGKLAAAFAATTNEAEWVRLRDGMRDANGPEYTKALTLSVYQLDGERRKLAREALSERLTRMTADTLRTMLKADDPELRRAAVLACAMKDDKAHVPDLVDRLTDDEEGVIRAAKAGLKSLAGQDFGPPANSTRDKQKAAAAAWKEWLAKQGKK